MAAPRLSPVLGALPRRAVSRLLGQLGRLRVPTPALQAFLRWYASRYGADLAQAARPLSDYRTFVEFFTRALAPGQRPPPEQAWALASPADGRVVATGTVERGSLLQVKGVPYALADLLGSADDAARFEGGSFLTVYLAPGDYHRFHWPLAATVHTVRHLPGDLWPVNARAVGSVPRLFARNERVVLLGRAENGGDIAFVPVGALNVGSIRLTGLPALRTNRSVLGPRRWSRLTLAGRRGDELGWFEFGSSFVLLLARDAGQVAPLPPGAPLRVGSVVGRVGDSPCSLPGHSARS